MVTLFTDPRMLDHVPPKGHPERPERLQTVLRHLARTGLDRACAAGTVREATAAQAFAVHGMSRVMVVDFDVHHGNGTQDLCYDDPRLAFLSIHRYPFYPGTGAADETGTGAAIGTKLNIPLPHGIPRSEYHAAFEHGLTRLADATRPELVLITAGFDAHAEDPVGDLGLEVEDFVTLTKLVAQVAETHAGGRLVSVLE